MTKQEAATLVALIRAAFPSQPFPPETTDLYVGELAGLPFAETAERVRYLYRTAKFPPSLGEIVGPVTRRLAGLPLPADAWLEVWRNLHGCHWEQHVGFVPAPRWSHPAVKAVVESLGGLYYVQRSDNLETVRAQFLRLYGQVSEGRLGDVLEPERVALPAPARLELEATP